MSDNLEKFAEDNKRQHEAFRREVIKYLEKVSAEIQSLNLKVTTMTAEKVTREQVSGIVTTEVKYIVERITFHSRLIWWIFGFTMANAGAGAVLTATFLNLKNLTH